MSTAPRVVIVGGGFGGLTAAQALARRPVSVTVLDRTNHHLFQPLLYQVAMAGLSPADIASPIRSILARQENVTVLLEEVERIDVGRRVVVTDVAEHAYDFLIVATGVKTDYFGHPEWERFAPGLKSIEDAIEIRHRVLFAFERAERDPRHPDELLTFVVIGGGPTGVELAGAIAELARHVLASDFREVDPRRAKVVLVEGGPRLLPSMPPELSESAREQLGELGVEVRTGTKVTGIDARGVALGDERIDSSTVVWAAGVRATRLLETLGAPLDRAGRVIVGPDASVPEHPEVFVIGDAAALQGPDGKPLPGVSPVAMQQARFVAAAIEATIEGRARGRFAYVDKGSMATIGRSRAVAVTRGATMSGPLAWLAWLVVHLWYLIGFRNRFVVLFEWAWAYVTYHRGARLITTRARGASGIAADGADLHLQGAASSRTLGP